MIYVFVEGPDDSRYFESVFGCMFGEHRIVEYAKMTKEKIKKYIQAIRNMPNSDYLFFSDEDGKGVDNKQNEIVNKYNCLESEKVFIVQYEIESWYYAGLDQNECKKLKINNFQFYTNRITKEQFYAKLLRPSDRKYIMAQMLLVYSKELAETRNNTFSNFYQKIKKESAAVS